MYDLITSVRLCPLTQIQIRKLANIANDCREDYITMVENLRTDPHSGLDAATLIGVAALDLGNRLGLAKGPLTAIVEPFMQEALLCLAELPASWSTHEAVFDHDDFCAWIAAGNRAEQARGPELLRLNGRRTTRFIMKRGDGTLVSAVNCEELCGTGEPGIVAMDAHAIATKVCIRNGIVSFAVC